MIQKDDRKYSFVVSYSKNNLIRVRRLEIQKRLAHACAGVAIFTVGMFSYGFYGAIKNQSTVVHAKSYSSGFQGGPEILETQQPRDEFAEKIRRLEQSFRDSDFTPSIYPLVGKINNEFGWRANPFGGSSTEHHPGMDIDGDKGTPVVATARGVVIKAAYHGGYGNLVEIDHGKGVTTRYGHLSEIDVEAGQEIARGQTIGKVGSTGRSTGPHLHYEVRIAGEAVNPRPFLPQQGASSLAKPE